MSLLNPQKEQMLHHHVSTAACHVCVQNINLQPASLKGDSTNIHMN